MDTDARARFDAKYLAFPGGCWVWIGAISAGYGQFRLGSLRDRTRRTEKAHRLAYERFVGPIPTGLHVCHRCDDPRCVNPEHLFLGTNADNVADRVAKGRSRSVGNRGERSPTAKLNLGAVAEIRRRVAAGTRQATIAREFGLSPQAISDVVNRRSWGDG